jgi:hypothetical protein
MLAGLLVCQLLPGRERDAGSKPASGVALDA